ncbi:MAG TPA: PAS domain S-box protein [Candidatus Scalindua sp.]|nr:PAS domain S-box protein [Candidatus Scalindua sp.]
MIKFLKLSKKFMFFFGSILTASILAVSYLRFLVVEKWLKNFSIRTKLTLGFVPIGIISIIITGSLCYLNTKNALKKVYFDKLTAIRETKTNQIESYFDQIRNQVITFSEDQMIIDAMNQFNTASYNVKKDNYLTDSQVLQYALSVRNYYDDEYLPGLNSNVKDKREIEQYWPEDDEAIILQYHYIANNQNSVGSKDNLEMAADASQYSRIHSKYHPIIRDYLKRFGYYDIFLVDAQTGHIVYSVFKEVDFATSLLTGPYKDTNFARAFKDARVAVNNDFTKLVDFEFYDPSYANPASFIASPIFDGDKKIGVLVFKVPINEINRVMTGNYSWKNEGLGESGETYIVGSDYKMRNDSRFIIEEPDRYRELLEQIGTDKEEINMINSHSTSIMLQEIRTEAAEDALKGNTDVKIIDDYRGIPVLSSYSPLSIKDVKWVMLSEIDKAEAFLSLYTIGERIYLVIVAISVLVTIIAFSISEDISRPILQLVKGVKGISKGDFSKRVIVNQKDEIGMLADSFNKMTDSLIEAIDKSEQALAESKEAREYSENLIETAQDAIICIDEKGMVSVWNQSAEKIFGYTRSEIIGLNIEMIIPEAYRRKHHKGLERFLKTGKAKIIGKTVELLGKTKEGIEISIEVSLSFQKIEEERYIFTGIIRDITLQKRTKEELLNRTEELERSNTELQQFVYVTSHDLRSPLVNIQGFSNELQHAVEHINSVLNGNDFPSAIKEKLATTLEEDIPEALKYISTSTFKMQSLLSGLLQLSRIGRSELYTKQLDMNKLISKVVGTFEYKIKDAGIMLHVDELPSCRGDEDQINQVFSNLLDNALKYLDRSREGIIKISGRKDAGQVVYCTEDNGIGIAAEHQDKIYEMFHRLNHGNVDGDGLGLTIIYRILERHGGKAWVESEPAKGSKFFVSLPG